MKKWIIIVIIVIFGVISTAYASKGFLIGQTDSGLYTICYYECVYGTKAITIKAGKLCPISIECD
ncbi:hypothetical protein LCGC14_2543580 [marine sediment metagenome]|uniref:Uncharacterized protein n=1 Tax=marine sediment metagenome TaxID=412755 RepID=A0A0F9D1I4_9ZZZZ|nr:hypothetical protein [Candidatus Scalindua sp.]